MSDTPKKFYLTTPIYYVNARPHIGHAYTTIVADVIARRHRLLGDDTFFLTGTDEHGQKIERSAIAAGIPPQQFADTVSKSFRDLWTRMGILDDSFSKDDPLLHRDFIRTTDPRHKAGVQRLFKLLQDRGHIYLSTYTGQYCISDEAYVDGPPGIRCPDCGRVTETVSESNYYFRLSAFQLPLLNLIESGPNGEPAQLAITPESRRNEVLSFLRGNVNAAPPPPSAASPLSSAASPLSSAAPPLPSAVIPSEARNPRISSPGDSNGQPPPSTLVILSEAKDREAANPTPTSPTLSAMEPGAPSFAASTKGGVSDEVRPLLPDTATPAHTAAGTPYVPGALKDLSISRTSFHWGVPVPGDEAHVIYVWLDALANYMTAIGYGSDAPADIAKFERFWPADLHLVGKEIIRFHCIYWPAFLLALNPAYIFPPAPKPGAPEPALSLPKGLDSETWVSPEPQRTAPPQLSPEDHRAWAEKMLPKAITAHGWLLFQDSSNEATKMSKSKGNIVRTETILDAFGYHYHSSIRKYNEDQSKKDVTFQPVPEPSSHDQDLFATDVLRYFLLREIPFGQDGSFSFDALIQRYRSDLQNGYGNLVSRTLSLIEQSFSGIVPERHPSIYSGEETGLRFLFPVEVSAAPYDFRVDAQSTKDTFKYFFERREFWIVLGDIWNYIAKLDGFITRYAPWKLRASTDENDRIRLSAILYTAAESIRIITALLYPILPYTTAKVWRQLGLDSIEVAARNGDLKDPGWGGLQPGTRLGPLAPIFPRADVSPDKGLAQIMADMEQNPEPKKEQKKEPDTPAPSKLTTETTSSTPPTPTDSTHPGAPPRTSAIEEHHPIAQVAGSASPTTQLHKPPSHTEAFASGPFNTAQSSQPMAQSSIENPAALASSQGQSPIATTSTTPTEGPATSAHTERPRASHPTEEPASTTHPEGPGFSRAITSPAEGGTALPKAVLPNPAATSPLTTSTAPTEGPAITVTAKTERPAVTAPTEGPGFSRAITSPAEGGTALPKAVLPNPASTSPSASITPAEGPVFSRAKISPAEGGTALPKAALPSPAINPQATAQITIDDFAKVELRVARILVAERIPKADRLLRLEVDLGSEKRQILSGIAEWYTPEELIGRKIVVITNLAPRRMRGLESHGMLLAASSGEDGKPALATFADSDNIEVGARLK